MTPAEWIAGAVLTLSGVTFLYQTHRSSIDKLQADNNRGREELQHTIKEMFISRLDHMDKDDVERDVWLQELDNGQKEISGEVLILKVTVAEHAKKIEDIGSRCERRHETRLRDTGV